MSATPDNTPKGKGNTILALVLSGAVAVIIWMFISGLPAPTRSTPPAQVQGPTVIDAYAACKESMKKQLKTPSSAVFTAIGDADFEQINANLFWIGSFVEAENELGNTVRIAFDCEASHIGSGRWQIQKLVTSED